MDSPSDFMQIAVAFAIGLSVYLALLRPLHVTKERSRQRRAALRGIHTGARRRAF